jgi:hypothetical protein
MPPVHSFAPGCRSGAGVRIHSETAATNGGRSWWAHFDFTRINIDEPIILGKKIEGVRGVGASSRLATRRQRYGLVR